MRRDDHDAVPDHPGQPDGHPVESGHLVGQAEQDVDEPLRWQRVRGLDPDPLRHEIAMLVDYGALDP